MSLSDLGFVEELVVAVVVDALTVKETVDVVDAVEVASAKTIDAVSARDKTKTGEII
jgi:hypothetical protein